MARTASRRPIPVIRALEEVQVKVRVTTLQEDAMREAVESAETPLECIHAFCLTCVGGYREDIKTCTSKKCPLYKCRMGRKEK